MASLKRYFELVRKHPDMFRTPTEEGAIKIITDPKRIRLEQAKIREKLKADGNPSRWIDIGVLSEDSWFWVIRDIVEFPNGKVGGYIRVINRRSQEGGFNVVIMCVKSDKVLLIKRFRHEERGFLWEFPRGFGETGLSAEDNALQELEQEVGLKPSRWVKLTTVKEGEGGTSAFYAEIPEGQTFTLEKAEAISDARWLTLSEFNQLIEDGKVADFYTLWAYMLVKIKEIIGRNR